jgi:transposase
MYDAMARARIQTLKDAGMGTGRVADVTGASERTVRRVAAEPHVTESAAAAATASARTGRPSKMAEHTALLRRWLEDEPDAAGVTLLTRLRGEGYEGGKSAFYEALRALRTPAQRPVVARFEGVAGEFSQHDFGHVWVRYQDDSREQLHFFASVLKFSRLRRVRVVPDETTESVCHSLADAFAYFGGVPLVSVFDNPRTIVSGRDGDQVRWQETFAHFCTEAGAQPLATWPRRPQEKGLVEGSVGFVKRTFFKVHRFRDRDDLDAKLDAWHHWANDERICRATGETPRSRHVLEAERLRPLTLAEHGYRLRYSRRVRTDGHAEFGGRRYYCGRALVGQTVTLHVGQHEVLIHDATEHVATHPRLPVNGSYSVLPEQRAELLEKRGARPYAMRQLLLDLCPAATWYLTEIRHRRPNHWSEQVEQLYALLEEHGESALQAAFIDAAARGAVGAEYIEAILAGHAAQAVIS